MSNLPIESIAGYKFSLNRLHVIDVMIMHTALILKTFQHYEDLGWIDGADVNLVNYYQEALGDLNYERSTLMGDIDDWEDENEGA